MEQSMKKILKDFRNNLEFNGFPVISEKYLQQVLDRGYTDSVYFIPTQYSESDYNFEITYSDAVNELQLEIRYSNYKITQERLNKITTIFQYVNDTNLLLNRKL